MNSSPDKEIPGSAEYSAASANNTGNLPKNWREALLTLVASRISLIQLESKEAAKDAANRVASLIAVVICAFFTWALLLAGVIAAIAKTSGCAWYWIAIAASAVHFAAAILLAKASKKPAAPSFPVTRAEFQKDREWIENFQKPRKSND